MSDETVAERRTVIGDVAGACGCDEAAEDADRLREVVELDPLFCGKRGGRLHYGGDGNEGDASVAAEEVCRGCDSKSGVLSVARFLGRSWMRVVVRLSDEEPRRRALVEEVACCCHCE